jgi:pimeloyl-ACP methyl ester carboxylesterase
MPGTAPESRTFKSQQLKLHLADWGNPSAPPLILVHGQRDHCRNWDSVAERLRDRFHVMAVDLRGHGESDWSPDGHYDQEAYLFDFAELIRHVSDGGRPNIIGHSLGGNIALRFAGIYPDKIERLICIEGLGRMPKLEAELESQPIDERIRAWIDSQRALGKRRPRQHESVEAAVEHMRKANPHLSAAQARHLTEHGLRQNREGGFSWKFDPRVRAVSPADLATKDIHILWSRISCPTLLAYGRESWASNPAEDGRLAHFRNARLVMFDDAGHWVHHDRLDRFLEEAEAFLAS